MHSTRHVRVRGWRICARRTYERWRRQRGRAFFALECVRRQSSGGLTPALRGMPESSWSNACSVVGRRGPR
jgi:hypothetical protein